MTMENDLVERLREPNRLCCGRNCSIESDGTDDTALEAADRIQALDAELHEAWNEAQCCDDTPLGQATLAQFIADQHKCRKAAEAELARKTEALKLAEGRLNLLMGIVDETGNSDHPGATLYVLNKVRSALRAAGESKP